jgi:hypothetical protein
VNELGRHKKGLCIDRIEIDDKGKMKVITEDGSELKVTRQERAVLAYYRHPNYEDEIRHAMSNQNIIGDDFRVFSNGKYVYHHHQLAE